MNSMLDEINKIDTLVTEGLKDFQRATVNRVEELYKNGQMRVLVSDEVGLGKTLIARGTIAKVARMCANSAKKNIKIVYVCSNSAVAEQNINKLWSKKYLRTKTTDDSNYSRLSMQHVNIFRQEYSVSSSGIRLIPLTPGTSFNLTRGAGKSSERALMFALMSKVPAFKGYTSALGSMLAGDVGSWSWDVMEAERRVDEINQISKGKYLEYMIEKLEYYLSQQLHDNETYLEYILLMCRKIRRNGNISEIDRYIVGRLRWIFAQISMDKLEPDLIIMDEFQRFKDLLSMDQKTDIGMLTSRFFNSENTRMLLLSATPYKMYSTLDEIEDSSIDEHYKEFLNVMKFLNITEEKFAEFKTIWKNYSIRLREISDGETTVIQAKKAAENAMYQNVSRTERVSAGNGADMIDAESVKTPVEICEQDIKSYLKAQELLNAIGLGFNTPVDYIKSAPYLLSFMKDYKFKKKIEEYFKNNIDEINRVRSDAFWLSKRAIDRYDKIPSNNARLDDLIKRAFENKAELLLWVPPSKTYYPGKGVFEGADNFSKTIVFSSWEMVPRMISGLVSYEAERRSIGRLINNSDDKRVAKYYSTGDKRYPSSRMTFDVKNGRPGRMPLMSMLYPSEFLTEIYNPIEGLNKKLTLARIEALIRKKIVNKLKHYPSPSSGLVDYKWYYLAPLLLDSEEYVQNWFYNASEIMNIGNDDNEKTRGIKTHFDTLDELYYGYQQGEIKLGKRPDDLVDVLVDLTIASPAVCINRTYRKYGDENAVESYMPSQVARVFINRMNTVESTATIEFACGKKSDDVHWKNVLTYCKNGNIQAVFDEYAHLLANGFDNNEDKVSNIHNLLLDSLDFRTTTYMVDTFDSFKDRMKGQKSEGIGIRSHFAVSFTRGVNKESDDNRKKKVRNAFNSPFRPFVLASTSIGQEGLDFHNYCRRIVHWNLPHNPIDLEQREGRINRFECLAIRQNIAKRYGDIPFENNIWEEMFTEAERVEKTPDSSDLIPYWGLTETADMIKIERVVPMYPFSKDQVDYERLIKILSLYRLTLGQARQEELLEYIFDNVEDTEKLRDMFINLSPYFRTDDSE